VVFPEPLLQRAAGVTVLIGALWENAVCFITGIMNTKAATEASTAS
jgi:hypothetical protein